MNVLFTNFHRGNGGGHDTYVMNLVVALSMVHRIMVAAPRGSRLFRLAQAYPHVRVLDVEFSPRGLGWLRELWKLWKLFSFERLDIIHVNGAADHRLVMLARLFALRAPRIIYTKHNDHRNRSVGNWMRARFGTDHVIAVSDYVAKRLSDSPYRRVPISTIHHGVDIRYFIRTRDDRRRGVEVLQDFLSKLPANAIVLASTAGTQYDKGWPDMLEAVAQLASDLRNRVGIILAGDAPSPCMRRRVDTLGLRDQVLFTGLLDDVRPVLAAADMAFVLSKRETLSFACREAMAMELPVLVSDAGGLPENVCDGKDGWIVPRADVIALKYRLEQILASPYLLKTMGRAAREKSQTCFGLDVFVDRTSSIYEAALREASLRPFHSRSVTHTRALLSSSKVDHVHTNSGLSSD